MEQNLIDNSEKNIEVTDNTQPAVPDNTQPVIPDNTINETAPIVSNINSSENNNLTNPIILENLQSNSHSELEKEAPQLISENNYNTKQNIYEDALKNLMKCKEVNFNPSSNEFSDESLTYIKGSLILIDEIKERIDMVKDKKESLDEIELKKRISKLEEENDRLKQELNNENGFHVISNNQISLFNDHFFS